MPLIDPANSVLAVIDVQENFLAKLAPRDRLPLVSRIGWIMKVAVALGIPIIATAEDVSDDVDMVANLKDLLPQDRTVHNKLVFSLYSQPDIRAELEKLEKTDVVLIGLETDVCIAHSAIELLDAGYRVSAVEDATASPWPHHSAGLRRMEQAGAIITNTKGLVYEWIRDIPTAINLEKTIGSDLPAGLTL